jgi:ABC-type transport system involved in multi-copper enzyme maturation permease subunit
LKQNLAIVIGVLFAATLISVAILLASLLDSPLIVLAVVLLIAVFGVVFALLLVTNTRRPSGIDPNLPLLPRDPFGMTSEDLRNAVLLADQQPYGRRKKDDRNVVERLSEILEDEASRRPAPDSMPPWVVDMNRSHQVDHIAVAPAPQEEES